MSSETHKNADFEAGIFFTLFGAATAAFSLQYDLGTIAAMGPGMFPLILGIVLTLLGIAIFAKSLFTAGESARPLPIRPTVLVTASVLIFAVLAETVGLLIAVPAQVFVAFWASEHFTVKRAAILSIGLLIFCYVVFIRLLGIAIPLITV